MSSFQLLGKARDKQQDAATKPSVERELLHIPPADLMKVSNARKTPCSLEEFASIQWPDLSTDEENLEEELLRCLANQSWFSASEHDAKSTIAFLKNIHSLAKSIADNGQLQPVIADRDSELDETFRLVAGERRTLSALYARGAIPWVEVLVYNRPLSEGKRARYQDQENDERVDLTNYERLISKLAILDTIDPDFADALSTTKAASLLGYRSKSSASLLLRLWRSERRQEILSEVSSKNLSWRKVEALIQAMTEQASTPANSGERSTVERKAAQARLKKYGVAVGRGTDHALLQSLIGAATGSSPLSLELAGRICNLDLENKDDLLAALDALAESLSGQRD